MAQVLLINPAERPSKVKAKRKEKPIMAKKQRSAAQRAATRKLVAMNKARSGGSKGKRVSRAKPASKRRKASGSYAIATVAPKRRKARRPFTSAAVASDAGRKLRYRRRNPIGSGFIGDTLIPAALGGGGALAVDVLLGLLALPVMMKTGPMAPIVKVAAAVGLGFAAQTVVSRKTAEQLAAGAITVTLYNVAKAALVKAGKGKIPGLSEYVGAYPDALFYDGASGGVVNGMGEFVSGPDESPAMMGMDDDGMGGDDDGMGYMNAGTVGELMPDGSVSDYGEDGVYR